MLRLSVSGLLAVLLAQEVPGTGDSITSLLGQLGAVGLVVAYAYWRQRHADELLKQRDATIAEMTKTMIESVVPALEKVAAAGNEQRAALERMIDAQRRGEYGRPDDRRSNG